jgi:hypothetical protein
MLSEQSTLSLTPSLSPSYSPLLPSLSPSSPSLPSFPSFPPPPLSLNKRSIISGTAGTVGYDELGTEGVSPVLEVKILRFGGPLFFANVGILKVAVKNSRWGGGGVYMGSTLESRSSCSCPGITNE